MVARSVNEANCLNKNLNENESLPHRENLNEILPKIHISGGIKDEAQYE
jgi:hypothetical protein